MKTWIKRTLIATAGACLAFGGLAAWSHRADHGHRWQEISADAAAGFKARIVERAGRRLDLDEVQKTRLGELLDRALEQRNALVVARPDPRTEMQDWVADGAFDRARAQAWVDAMTQSVRDGSPALIAAMADFYDGLRPDQQGRLRELLQHGRRWHGRS